MSAIPIEDSVDGDSDRLLRLLWLSDEFVDAVFHARDEAKRFRQEYRRLSRSQKLTSEERYFCKKMKPIYALRCSKIPDEAARAVTTVSVELSLSIEKYCSSAPAALPVLMPCILQLSMWWAEGNELAGQDSGVIQATSEIPLTLVRWRPAEQYHIWASRRHGILNVIGMFDPGMAQAKTMPPVPPIGAWKRGQIERGERFIDDHPHCSSDEIATELGLENADSIKSHYAPYFKADGYTHRENGRDWLPPKK